MFGTVPMRPQTTPGAPPQPLKIEISDEYLLKELIDSLTRVCQTCPFLKSKTSSFIQNSFLCEDFAAGSGASATQLVSKQVGSATATKIIKEALDYLNL